VILQTARVRAPDGRLYEILFRAVSTRVSGPLDDVTFRRLSGAGLTSRSGEAILIATVDEHGRPHPALLSYAEVLAVAPDLLRLMVAAESTTARNLAARGAVTLCLVTAAEGALYVKARARALSAPALSGAGRAAFEARVEEVRADAPTAGEAARLTSGITFVSEATDGQAADGAARLEALRRA
jgi:hypothetical protein